MAEFDEELDSIFEIENNEELCKKAIDDIEKKEQDLIANTMIKLMLTIGVDKNYKLNDKVVVWDRTDYNQVISLFYNILMDLMDEITKHDSVLDFGTIINGLKDSRRRIEFTDPDPRGELKKYMELSLRNQIDANININIKDSEYLYEIIEDLYMQVGKYFINNGLISLDDDKIDKMFGSFFSIDYSPPENDMEILFHILFIFILRFILRRLDVITELGFRRLTLSEYKLIGAANYHIGMLEKQKAREWDRLIKSKNSPKKLNKMQFVYEIYYRSEEVKIGMSKLAVAKAIKRVFERFKKNGTAIENLGAIPENMKVPSLDRIKDYLWEDPKIKADFKLKGRFHIKYT